MTDNKLEKLIEEYGSCKYTQSSASSLMNSGFPSATKDVRKSEIQADKAKKAILDYVEKEKQKAADNVRDAFVKAINDMGKANKPKPALPEA